LGKILKKMPISGEGMDIVRLGIIFHIKYFQKRLDKQIPGKEKCAGEAGNALGGEEIALGNKEMHWGMSD
jgi:hypothetical protein